MIVGIDVSRMVITDTPTGVERVSNELIPRVVDNLTQDNNVSEIWLYSSRDIRDILVKYGWENNIKVKQKVLKMPFKLFWTLIRLTLHFANPINKKPDVFWVPSHIMPLWLPLKTKSFQHMHDISWRPFPGAYSWRSKLVLELGMIVARLHKTFFFYISNFTKSEVEKYYKWPTNRGEVVYLGGDHFQAKSEKVKTKSEGSRYLFFVSRLEEKKGTKFLLKAFDELKKKYKKYTDLKLILVGKGGFGYEKIEETLDSMQYKQDVEIKGFVGDEELKSLISNATLFVIPSLYEGFGITALEAFSYGVPLISSNRTCLPEIIGDGALFFDPKDTNEFVSVIDEVLDNSQLRQNLVEKGSERFKKFKWEESAKNISEILSSG